MDLDTLELLRTSVRHVLTEPSDRPLAERLAELGWDEVIADDEPVALRTLFGLKGETLSTADALGPQLGAVLAAATGDGGLAGAAVVVPWPVMPVPPAGPELTVRGVLLPEPAGGAPIVVPVGDPDDVRLATVPSGSLHVKALGGTDAELGLVEVSGAVATSDLRWAAGDDHTAAWAACTARARWLLAAELVGVGRHVIASAVEYTGARIQYGKPIGTFQALQHRLAAAHALVVGAGHVTEEASATDDPWVALVAKCLAGRAAENACTQAQQCYGAIGFTWEHEFHRYLRRTYVLDRLFGDWRSLELEIGTTLQRTGHVPQIGTL